MMKTLSIKQPWAELIVSGVKDIENRSWRTRFRGRIYVHASASMEYRMRFLPSYITQQQFDSLSPRYQHHLTQGIWVKSAIIGEVDIIDCVENHPSIWAVSGQWHWVLADAIKYDQPILNVKGKLSFWEY